ncbi:hypothetical protein HOY80DRAFT_1030526 [Tuber brumale]|nr:hypothetical protein HOY80DRAFT_1030526 [Tuber brumale]
MGYRKTCSSVKSSLATTMVPQKAWKKSLALESENSKLRHHVSVLSRRLHEVIAKLKVQSKITAEKVEFAGGIDVVLLETEEEVVVEAEKKIGVWVLVAVIESVASTEVAADVAMVEVVDKGKEVAVVAEEAEEGVGSQEEDWTLMKRRVRESREDRRRRMLEEERDMGRKTMNVWHRAIQSPEALTEVVEKTSHYIATTEVPEMFGGS